MEKLERSAVRSLLQASREPLKYFTAQEVVEAWEPTQPLQEVSLNATSKPPRPLTRRPRRPQKPTPEPKPPTPDPLPSAPSESHTSLHEYKSDTLAPDPPREDIKSSRRASVDLSVVQMPPPVQKHRRPLQSWRNTPISVAPIPRPLSLNVKDVQRALSENSRKYGLRTSSNERKLTNLRGKMSFHSYVALKT